MISKEKLEILLEVRDILKKNCPLTPTPSSSPGDKRTTYDQGYNDGLIKSFNTVMAMIERIAKFVSVCCGAKEIWKTASHATLPDNVLLIGV